jgi:hypothetical protein
LAGEGDGGIVLGGVAHEADDHYANEQLGDPRLCAVSETLATSSSLM